MKLKKTTVASSFGPASTRTCLTITYTYTCTHGGHAGKLSKSQVKPSPAGLARAALLMITNNLVGRRCETVMVSMLLMTLLGWRLLMLVMIAMICLSSGSLVAHGVVKLGAQCNKTSWLRQVVILILSCLVLHHIPSFTLCVCFSL